MTDKVQKILSEIATRKLCTMDEHMAFYNDKAKEDYWLLSEIEEFIKSSQEEPVSSIWYDVSRETPTEFGKAIIVLCRNKNMEDGIWLADLIQDWEGEWEPRTNWETPVKWAYVKDLINLTPLEATNMGEQEPVSEDLEVAAKSYSAYRRGDDTEISYDINRYEGVIAGAIWQKQQMMKDAVELPLYLDGDFLTVDYDFTESGYKVGDKVKMIIIKEK